jgi:hypothetical protein
MNPPMLNASAFALALQAEPTRVPLSFMTIVLVLLGAGAVGWLVATVLGFTRARAFGPSTRWFACSALCLLLYHVQWFAWVVFGFNEKEMERVIFFGGFFNLFVLLGSICAIIGFVQLNKNTDDRP